MEKVLLLEPNYFGYNLLIKKELERQGYYVDWMDDRPSSSILSKGLIRLKPKLLKRKIHNYFYGSIFEKAKEKQYDYIVVILGQSFNSKMFLDLKKVCPKTKFILYLWDSVRNFPLCEELSRAFDITYSFDKNDCKIYGFQFLPLFFSNECSRLNGNILKKYDASFIGTIKKGKLPLLDSIKKQLNKRYRNVFFYYYLQSEIVFMYNKLLNKEFKKKRKKDFNYNKLSYLETLQLFADSKFVIDVPMANQDGLSMRTFEALAMHCKLLTTNKAIVQYDFYNPRNIYVFDKTLDFNNVFFNSDFDESVDSIFQQYSIENWAKKLLK